MKRRLASTGARMWIRWIGLAVILAIGPLPLVAGLPLDSPESVGLNGRQLQKIDDLVADGIRQKKLPGCVVCVGRRGRVVWLRAYGNRQVQPTELPMTTDTIFDLASITKPVATATSIMLLVERQKLCLSDTVASRIPEFAANGKEAITIRDLLIHQSGLIADNPIGDYNDGPGEALRRICNLKLVAPTGSKFIYSDVNFIVLGEVVKRVSGQPLDQFASDNLFTKLGLNETGFRPPQNLIERIAPTEQRDGKWIQGEVHDPRSFKLGGVAGHAGLFSSAADLAVYAQMLLNGGEFNGIRVMNPQTLELMTRGEPVPGGIRGLGWDKKTGYSRNRGERLTDAAFGHGGFTGTVLWIDPKQELFFIFLSNRVHPNGKGSVNPLAGEIATVTAAAILDGPM